MAQLNSPIKMLQALTNDKRGCGFETITLVNDGTVYNLTPPEDANYALCVIESDDDTTIVARFRLDGEDPTSSDGIPVVHLQGWDLNEMHNLGKFKIVVVSATATATALQVQYFK